MKAITCASHNPHMACPQLWTHTALLHPSTPLASLCTCLPSHRSTPVRPFPSPHRLLLTPVYAASPSSASPPCSSHSLAVFLSPLCLSPVQSCPRHPQGYHPHQVRLLSLPSLHQLTPSQSCQLRRRIRHHRRLLRILRQPVQVARIRGQSSYRTPNPRILLL